MKYLLDTNVLSELRKPTSNSNVSSWFNSVKGDSLFLSVLVVGEIPQGIEQLAKRDPRQAEVFKDWLAMLLNTYRRRIVPISTDIAQEWGRMNATRTLPVIGLFGS